MSSQHGIIEFVNHHVVAAQIDVLDADNDEYFIGTVAPDMAMRQYTPPGTRWSVRLVYPAGMAGATFINVRDDKGEERFSRNLGDLAKASDAGAWTIEVQYVVTAQAGAQTYVITREGVNVVPEAAVGAPPDDLSDMVQAVASFRRQQGVISREVLRSRQT